MIRARLSLAAASALTVAGSASAQEAATRRARTYVRPYVEASQILTADLNDGDIVTFTTLSVGVDAGVNTARSEAQIGLRYDRLISWDDDVGDSDVLSGLARGSYLVAPGLTIEAGGIATRARSDNRGSAPGVLIGEPDNITQIYSLYAGPTLSRPVGMARLDAGYRIGYTKVETPDSVLLAPGLGRRDFYDDATNHLATARLSVAPGAVLPVGLALSAGYEREDAGQLGQRYEGVLVRGDVLAPVSATVALAAGVGYEKIESSSRQPLVTPEGAIAVDDDGRFLSDPSRPRRVDYRTDGVYYDAGVVWRPNRRTEARASIGERYGSFSGTGSLSYQASESVGLAVGVYDGVQTFGRQLRQGIANLPTSFVSARDQFTQTYNGCVFGTSGRTPGGCLNAVFQSINTTSYRARGIDAVISATRGVHQFGAGAGYANRRLHAGRLPVGVTVFGVEDESVYGSLFYARSLTPASGFNAQAFLNYYNTVGLGDDEVYAGGAVATYFHRFGRLQTTASAGIYGFQVGDFDDQWSAQALLGARYSF
ncbi:hypothetical protein [uncultured Sphingomonas sp.]|uniref:hypothetical protein n=1 Tax=uncultured Sphingomonas sp. TaxID=158754 RepID=UPI0035CB0F8C